MQIAALTLSPSLSLLKSPRHSNLAFRHGFVSMRISCSSYDRSSLRNSVHQSPSLSWPARSWSLSFRSSKVSPWPGSLLASDSGKVRAASVPESATEDALEIQEKDLESEESLLDLYERWRRRYRVTRQPEEMNERFKVFKQEVEYIYRFNQMEKSCKLGLNPFTDRRSEEMPRGLILTGLPTEEEMGVELDDDVMEEADHE